MNCTLGGDDTVGDSVLMYPDTKLYRKTPAITVMTISMSVAIMGEIAFLFCFILIYKQVKGKYKTFMLFSFTFLLKKYELSFSH
jgi:hypothetical protein